MKQSLLNPTAIALVGPISNKATWRQHFELLGNYLKSKYPNARILNPERFTKSTTSNFEKIFWDGLKKTPLLAITKEPETLSDELYQLASIATILLSCDTVCLTFDFAASIGATVESLLAEKYKLKVILEIHIKQENFANAIRSVIALSYVNQEPAKLIFDLRQQSMYTISDPKEKLNPGQEIIFSGPDYEEAKKYFSKSGEEKVQQLIDSFFEGGLALFELNDNLALIINTTPQLPQKLM